MFPFTMSDGGGELGAELPLVLVTVGDDAGELDVLSELLESAARERQPSFQGLIVAKPDMSKMMYRVLSSRIGNLRNVYLRRLGDTECETRLHETGTFLVSKQDNEKKD